MENEIGTIQYWLEVQRIGSLLFQNIECADDALRSLINSVLETPLLLDIECLSSAEEDDPVPCPFTAWILQGLLKAAIFTKFDSYRDFYVDAQQKLLTFANMNSVSDFDYLIKLYIKALNDILKLEHFSSNLKFLLQEDYLLQNHDRKLICASFEIRNKKEQIILAKVVLEVIRSVKLLMFNYCCDHYSTLWDSLLAIINSNVAELKYPVISILSEMCNYNDVSHNENELKDLGHKIMSMIDDYMILRNQSYQEDIIKLWSALKKQIRVSSFYDESLVKRLLKAKDLFSNKNFIYDELSSVSPHALSNSIRSYFLEQDEICILFSSVLNDVKNYLSSNTEYQNRIHKKEKSEKAFALSVKEMSQSWEEILSHCMKSPKGFNARNSSRCCFKNLVEFCCKALSKLDEEFHLSRHRLVLSFFGNDLGAIVEKVINALKMPSSSSKETLTLSMKALSDLLTLPEVECASDESLKGALNFLLPPIMSDKFFIPGYNPIFLLDNSTIPSLFFRSLSAISAVLAPEICLSLLIKCGAWKDNAVLKSQVLKSVPVFVIRNKVAPVEVMRNVLFPAFTNDNMELRICAITSFRDVVCSLAGSAYIARNADGEQEIKCRECSSPEGDGCKGSEGNNLMYLQPEIIRMVLEILKTNDPRVKVELIKSLHRLTVHLTCFRDGAIMERLLEFMQDEDEGVRHGFAGCITKVIFGPCRPRNRNSSEGSTKWEDLACAEEIGGSSVAALDITLKKIEELIRLSLKSKSHAHLQTSLLETTSEVACYPTKKFLGRTIRLLLLFMNQPNAPLPAIFLDVASAHRTTQLVLYYSYRPEISQFLGNLIVVNRLMYGLSLRSTLVDINAIFKGLSHSRFAAKSESYIVPIIFKWIMKYAELEELLYEWCEYVDQPPAVVVSHTFQNIYTYILLDETSDVFDKCMIMIEKLTDLNITDLTVHSQKAIINELLFNHHRLPDKVISALKNVVGGLDTNSSIESLVDALETRFVGFLLFVVRKFVKDINADSEKVHAIRSLTSVIKLMGRKYVTPVARKVLATLQTTLGFNFTEFLVIHFDSLRVFIETVDIEQLGPLLATIITLLIPFLDYDEVDVETVFTYLIVENESLVKKYLPNLIFLPQHPKLEKASAVLKKYINFKKETLKDRLIRETSLALHETVYIRAEGLKALSKTAESSSSEMQNLINGSDEPDPCIKKLLQGLILCCSDPDPNISVLAATCLGQLGAIDPGLLPRKPKPKNQLPLSVHDPEFAFLALTQITKAFQNARKSVDMDAFAVAIQELLKMYDISPSGENRIWSRFPKQIQGLMMPMLSSRYKVQALARNSPPEIIFGSKEANSHMSWASLWASKLIGYCKEDRVVTLFKVCEPSLKCDVKVLLFFLRYILLHAIIRDPAVHGSIIKEIESVVEWSGNTVESDTLSMRPRPVRLIGYCGYPSMKSTITTADAQTCAMTVFLLVDFLNSWLRIYRDVNFSPAEDQCRRKEFTLVKAFLDKIDYRKISIANYEIREYARSIMYLEDVIGQDKAKLSEHLPLLSKAYALYGDLDSVAGASSFQKAAPKMEDLLLSHRVSGQLEEVRIIFEKLGKSGLMTPAHMQEMSRCYLNLGEPYTAMNCIRSFTSQQPDLMTILSEGMVESFLKLGDYSQLSKFLENDEMLNHTDWFVQIGRIILGLHEDDEEGVKKALSNVRTDVANALRQTGLQFGDYQQCYPYLIKLQILCEIENVAEIIRASRGDVPSSSSSLAVKRLLQDWDTRCGFVQSDPSSLEPILSIRRILLSVAKVKLPTEEVAFLDNEIAKSWVKSAEIARKAGCFHQSYNFILNAEQYNNPSTFIEKAQLFWDKGDQDLCLFTLNRGIHEFFPVSSAMKNLPPGERLEERKLCAEAKLLYAIYNEETSNCDHNTNITNYQDAFDVCRQLEKSQAFLALCLDRVVSHLEEHEQNKTCELKVLMVHHFGKSLMHGCEYIYQTVPRMLSIWLDLGEEQDTPEKVNALVRINKLIEYFLEELPPFIFMTALPQLISRIGHPNGKVLSILKTILATLVKAFPQQSLWALQAIAKSSIQPRVQRYNEFIQHPMLRSANLYGLIGDFTSLCDELNKLANFRLPQSSAFRGLKVSSILRQLPRLLSSQKFSAIILPITRFCSISLPKNIRSSTHEPFIKDAVYITGVSDEITVLPSLQKPRKISFRGSDGKLYDILCKPTDDLRRDGRLMEFNNIVNMYLHRDPESRARDLHIRTYVVIPLGEEGGLIEWVPNLVGLRKVLIRLYKQFGKYTKPSELKTYECRIRDPLEKKRSVFIEKLLPLHPPLFPEWFRMMFPDPSGWYLARQSYTRTTAVMSMVGYILGLGDRHGENILFDCESGDTVHVDFNCLFNKGETMDWKERVPFRLTHNMIAAMGPFGIEGTFRKSCEISLRVLRSQAKTLTSVLRPFAYDPCGSWGKNKEIVQNERDQKMGEAHRELSDIEKRLNGSLRVKQKNSTLYLSVEGQVRSLIMEATNIDNLCQMYFGWGAYL